MAYIDERTQKFLDNIISGASNEELFKVEKPQVIQRDPMSEAIVSFAPALLGAVTGESGALAAPGAAKQAREYYDTNIKNQQEVANKAAEMANKQREKALELNLKVDKEIADRDYKNQQLAQTAALNRENQDLRKLQIEAMRDAARERIAASNENKKAKEEEKNRLSDKQVESLNEIDTAKSDIQNILALKQSSKIDTGPLAGRVPNLMSSEEVNAFRSALGRYKDQYRKAITGAGAGPTEIAMLEQRLPSEKDNDETFLAKAIEAEKELDRRREIYLSNLKKQGRNTVKFEETQQKKTDETIKRPSREEMIKALKAKGL